MTDGSTSDRNPVVLLAGEGRTYDMGPMQAVFKADGDETAGRYNISEWWMEPHTEGPGAHHHPEDDTFYVLEGTMDFFVADRWISAPAGAFVLVPGGVTHTFRNSSDERCGALNIGAPGGFEQEMPGIVAWFDDNPLGPA